MIYPYDEDNIDEPEVDIKLNLRQLSNEVRMVNVVYLSNN